MKKRVKLIPVKKMGTPEDIANMVFYLGSPLNEFITNEILTEKKFLKYIELK